jgi:hypothetical protein
MKPRDVKKIVNEMVQEGLLPIGQAAAPRSTPCPIRFPGEGRGGMSDEGKE